MTPSCHPEWNEGSRAKLVIKMITTKTGDKGQTTCGNKRVDKDEILVEVIGTIDELQANLGVLKCNLIVETFCRTSLQEEILEIQKDLYKISGELACDIKFEELKKRVLEIESEIFRIEKELPELKEFVIPGENMTEAMVHVCRTIARRVERRLVTLNKSVNLNQEILKYFNRLSDYLFIIARTIKN